MIDIEICVEQLQTALVADNLGAKRVELCSALNLGGLSPSAGLIEACSHQCTLDVYVMIRPREGGFYYSDFEIAIMKSDIHLAKRFGAAGVVFGCLNQKKELDEIRNLELLEEAKSLNMKATFHRAIDYCLNVEESIGKLVNWGFDRILTSGQAKTAIEGIAQLKKWKKNYGNKIEIMAGSGVNASNAKLLIDTNIDALHFTSRRKKETTKLSNMGYEYEVDLQKMEDVFHIINKED